LVVFPVRRDTVDTSAAYKPRPSGRGKEKPLSIPSTALRMVRRRMVSLSRQSKPRGFSLECVEWVDFSALKETVWRVKNGSGLVVFHQGELKSSVYVNDKPQAGAGFLASKLKVPLIPAFIKGTEIALLKRR